MKWVLAAIALLSLSGCLLSDHPLLQEEQAVSLLSEGEVSTHSLVPGPSTPDKSAQVHLLADGDYEINSAGKSSARLRFVMLEKDIYVASSYDADGKTLYWLAKPAGDHIVRLQLVRITDKVGAAAVAAGATCHHFPRDPAYPNLPIACEFSTRTSLLAVVRIAAAEPAAAVDMLDLIQHR